MDPYGCGHKHAPGFSTYGVFLWVADVGFRAASARSEGGRLERTRGWPRPRTLRRPHWGLARCGLPGRHCFSAVRVCGSGRAYAKHRSASSGASFLVAGGRLELARGWPRPRTLRRPHWGPARCGLPGRHCFSAVRVCWLRWAYKNTGAARLRCVEWWLEADSNCRPRDYEDLDENRWKPVGVRDGGDRTDPIGSSLVHPWSTSGVGPRSSRLSQGRISTSFRRCRWSPP